MNNAEKLKQLLERKRKSNAFPKEDLQGRYKKAYDKLKAELKRETQLYALRAIHSGFGASAYQGVNEDYYKMLRSMCRVTPEVRQLLTDGANNGDYEMIDKAACILSWMGFVAWVNCIEEAGA